MRVGDDGMVQDDQADALVQELQEVLPLLRRNLLVAIVEDDDVVGPLGDVFKDLAAALCARCVKTMSSQR